MRRISPLFFIAFLSFNMALAQSRLLWSSVSSQVNSQITDARSFAVDTRGNSFSVNYSQSALSLYETYVFYAHDANGFKLWEYANDSCLTDCNDKYFNIIPIDDNGAIFIGAFDDITGTQIRIKRIDANGTLLWEQYWISPFLAAQPLKSFLDNSGNIIVGLSATLNILDQEDFAVAKFDTTNGYLDWHIELPDNGSSPTTYSEIISSLKADSNNDIYGVGSATNNVAGVVKNYYFKIDANGVLDYIDESSYSGLNSSSTAISVDNLTHFYTLGFDGTSPTIEKRSSNNGNLSWTSTITRDSAVISNVGFKVVGNSIYCADNFTYFIPDTSPSGGYWKNYHYMMTNFDTNGNFQWQKDYFTETDSIAQQDKFGGLSQFEMCDNAFYFLSAQHLDANQNILILHKTDASGSTIWYDTAAVDQSPGYLGYDAQCDLYVSRTYNNENLTQKFTSAPLNSIADLIEQKSFIVYPNPATDKISIAFDGEDGLGSIYLLYNNLGKVLLKGNLADKEISLNGFLPGIYFIELITAKNKIFTKSFIKN